MLAYLDIKSILGERAEVMNNKTGYVFIELNTKEKKGRGNFSTM